jgi:fermentation-respiration switch protein FrsA (DUF1100 family)
VRPLIKGMVFLLVGAYAVLLLVAAFLSDGMIFQPQPSSYRDTADILKLTTRDGKKISAIYLFNPLAKYTILFSHGNAEDIGDDRPLLEEFRDSGFSVFAYDYHGYGTSEGRPGEQNSYMDVDAAYEYLTQTLHLNPASIISYGRSVGGGPAIDLASRRPMGGLIVQSGFTSAFRVLALGRLIPFRKFNNLAKIARVRCPILVMHGRADEVIPFRHGESLLAAAHEPKSHLWVDGAGHNDFDEVAGKRLIAALGAFAQSLP